MRELRQEYVRAIQEKQDKADTLREDYKVHKERVVDETVAAVSAAFARMTD